MKKLISVISIVAMMLCVPFCVVHAETEGDYQYTVKGDTAVIVKYTGSETGALVIPATLGGKKVVEIGEKAFENCPASKITISDGCEKIGVSAFSTCPNATRVYMPDTVTEIGDTAFMGCASLSKSTQSKNLVKLGYGAYKYCIALKEVYISNVLREIPAYCFNGCDALEIVKNLDKSDPIGYSVRKVGTYAFGNCKVLERVYLHDGVAYIDKNAFYSSFNVVIRCTQDSIAYKYCKENSKMYKVKDKIDIDAAYRFDDVVAGSWYHDYVTYAANHKFMVGMTVETFQPTGNVTRAQFVQILAKLNGVYTDVKGVPISGYVDVDQNAWYAQAVQWATQSNICQGISWDRFGPNLNIKRQDICLMLMNYYVDFKERELPDDRGENTFFADDKDISEYAYEAVYYCKKAGLVSGKDGNKFDPKGSATRAEICRIIVDMYKNYR